MRRALVVVLALGLAACGGAGARPSPTATTADGCPDVAMIGVRGQNQSPDANGGLGTELRLLTTALRSELDGRRVDVESIDYDSNPPPDLESYDRAVTAGAGRLDQRLDRWAQRCSDTRLIVVGFSMGAQVVHTALADRDDPGVAVVGMVADPRRDPAAPGYTFGGSAPNPGSIGAGPPLTGFEGRALWFCTPADTVCNHPPGTSSMGTNEVHKHFYEDPGHRAAMVDRLLTVLHRR